MAALRTYISSILLVSMTTTFSPSNAFLSVGEGFCGVPSGLLCPRCCCCCPQPRPCGCCCPSCPPPPPRCCLCQPPPVMAWAPPSPCTACHSVARRCCPPPPPPQPLWAPPSPFFQQQQQFTSPVHQQLIMSSDFNGVAATSFGVGRETAAAHLPPPVVTAEAQQQQQQRIQPIIYVLGGAPLAPSANETVGGGPTNSQMTEKSSNGNVTVPAEIAAEESTTESSSSSAKTTAAETLSDSEPSNSTTTTTAKPPSTAAAALNLIPKVKLRINPSKRLAVKTATEAKREKSSKSKLKHFFDDEEQSENEAQALYDYEEEEPKTISTNKVAASKLFKMGMGLFTKRDKLLMELLENRKRNSRRKRISNGPAADVCNSRRMARVMGNAIVEESSIAKRLVKRALQYSFPDSQFDVICAAGGVFSYAIYGKRHCEVQRKGVTCLAFE